MTSRGALLSVLARFARSAPYRLAGGIVLVAAALAMGAGLLAASGTLIAGSALAGLGIVAFNTFTPGAIVRALAVGRTAARYAERLSTHDATLRFLADLRVDTFRRMAARQRDTDRPALLFNRLTGDLDALDGVVIRLAVPLLAALAVLGGTAMVLWLVSPWLALGITAPLALAGLVLPLSVGAVGRRAARAKQHALDAARVRLVDLDRGRAALGAAGRMARAAADVDEAFARAAAAERRLAGLDLAIRVASGLGHQIAILAAVVVGAALHGEGALSATGYAAVVLFSLALGEAIAPFRAIAVEEGRWSLAARRIAALSRDGDARKGPADRASTDLLTLSAVSVRAPGADMDRLTDATLRIPPCARIALVGPSGGGKSTLLGLVAGTVEPSGGTVEARPGLRIARLGQRTELFRGTVADNLRLADPDASDADLEALVAAVGLGDALGAEGIARRLGDAGGGLSGGERRRLAIARTLLQEADLYLFDEPTEGLDAATATAIFAFILERTRGGTLVYATHRPAEAACADRRVTVRDGRIVAPQIRAPEPASRPGLVEPS